MAINCILLLNIDHWLLEELYEISANESNLAVAAALTLTACGDKQAAAPAEAG